VFEEARERGPGAVHGDRGTRLTEADPKALDRGQHQIGVELVQAEAGIDEERMLATAGVLEDLGQLWTFAGELAEGQPHPYTWDLLGVRR
jgi:hypothetical protein